MAAAATATATADANGAASPVSPGRKSTSTGRTRSAAARAIFASNTPAPAYLPLQEEAETAATSTYLPSSSSSNRNSLLGALTSLTRPGGSRRIPPPETAAPDLEAQRTAFTQQQQDNSPQFGIGEDDDDEGEEADRTLLADISASLLTSQTRSRYKSSDSTQETDQIGGGGSYDGPDYADVDDDDDDDAAQYASMVEQGSEYTSLLQLKPVPAAQSRAANGKPAGRVRPPEGEEEGGGTEGDYQAPSRTSSKRRTTQTSTEFSPAPAMPATVVPPFEPISRGEKTWMWSVAALVSALIIVAMLISGDIIDWPGDGIGRD
ncbi:unnamed protein product [Tilletia controversa]|nr:unnamed protein product [Tilletia controversa]CAD6910545.1 unnamed protein product [Tilletia controversa]CAD6972891.1 unnamed protein product [Tilletia controversa]CAD6979150.1 unnamed protein product [Tilletia controversa]